MGRRRRSPEAKKRIAARREQRKSDERQKAVGKLGEDQVAMNEKLDLPIGFDPNRSGGFQNSAEARKHREYMKTFEQAKEQDFRDSTITKDNLAQSVIDTATGMMGGGQDGGIMDPFTGMALGPLGGGPGKGQPRNPNGNGGKPNQAQDPYQTGAPRGSYMDRVRRQRAQQGQAGFGQYGPMQDPGPYAGGPASWKPGGFQQNPTGADRPQVDYKKGFGPGRPMPQRKRTYNPQTGLME